VRETRFDVVVIGSGPGGSVAALELARGGARVALVDKATFPRDKACGDMVGPRGLRLLADLGLPTLEGPYVGDMLVVGPKGKRVRMPSAEGLTYPGHGTAVKRSFLDEMLHGAALEAGAVSFCARAVEPLLAEGSSEGSIDGYRLSTGQELRADFVIGADGATSGVATAAGLVEPSRLLWGCAMRTYVPKPIELAAIVTWEPSPWKAFPGYGWAFPAAEGANIGLGIATRSNRHAGAQVARALPAFLAHLGAIGLLDGSPSEPPGRPLGGWLKMGIVGTTSAAGSVLLVGDAAGLINPLQGEGIAQAMSSGRFAARAILTSPGHAAESYRSAIAAAHLPYQRIAAVAQSALAGRPRAISTLTRLLTVVSGLDSVAGGWAVFWNELLDGAPPGRHRSVATAITRIGYTVTKRTESARWFDRVLGDMGGPGVNEVSALRAPPPGRPALRP
jgi:menaquinone-9 beta-reductase